MRDYYKKRSKLKSLISIMLSFAMVWTMIPGLFLMNTAYAAAGEVPAHSKTIKPNGDGTHQLELSVTGDADTEVETAANVNVLVVFDTSNSMNNNRASGGNTGPRRSDAAEKVVYDFTQALFKYKAGSDATNIQMALMRFNHDATLVEDWTSTETTITDHLSATGNFNSAKMTYHSGTNYEVALQETLATLATADKDPTFVIFVTDGAPSQVEGTRDGVFLDADQCYGPSQDEARNIQIYDTAKHASDAETSNTKLYGIYAYGTEADYLDDVIYYAVNGTKRANERAATDPTDQYYNSSSTEELTKAIEAIFQEIVETLGIAEVSMTDGTTSHVETTSGEIADLLDVDNTSFKYWISIPVTGNSFTRKNPVTGKETTYTLTDNGDGTITATGGEAPITVKGSISLNAFKFQWESATELSNGFAPPAASYSDAKGSVDWNLSSVGTLLTGATYSVTFDVYPSQYTYDTIAQIDNGDLEYSSLDDNVKDYLKEDGSLYTNTAATLTYTDTRTEAGSKTVDYVNPGPVGLEAEKMSIHKDWENELDARAVGSIDMTVLMDEKEFHKATLSENDNPKWTKSPIYISTGLMRTRDDGSMQILDAGHDFTFAELGAEHYNWELVAPVMHPMIIDGTLTMLIMVDDAHPAGSAKTYTLNGKTYYVAGTGEANLNAYNYRRSNLNLFKVVDGEDADPDQTFPFSLVVNNGNATPAGQTPSDDTNTDDWVWFSIDSDPDPDVFTPVTDAVVTGATQSGNYYYTRSGSTITVQMKANWNLRFTNLPTGTTYTFTEGTMPANYAFKSSELTNGTDNTFSGAQTTTGTIQNTNTSYEVKYTNVYSLTDVDITKVWNDNSNQDGVRPTAEQFVSWLKLMAGSDDVTSANADKLTVTDNGDNTYTAKWTGLDRFADGEEIEYTVTETPSSEYTADKTSVEDGGTITNTHTPKPTTVNVSKTWSDANNQDGIRPGSVTVQLYGGDEAVGDPVTLSGSNSWAHTWDNLPMMKGGQPIQYTVTETAVEGYSTTYASTHADDYSSWTVEVTNTHTPAVRDYQVVKVWDDANNKDGARPEELTVYLYANGEQVNTATLTDDKLSHTWTNLPVNKNGQKITYSAGEAEIGKGYSAKVEVGEDTTTITNSRKSDEVSYTVVKVWEDGNNQDGIRPTSIQAQLFADGEEYGDPVTLNNINQWTYTWNNLPKNKDIEVKTSEDNSADNTSGNNSSDEKVDETPSSETPAEEKVEETPAAEASTEETVEASPAKEASAEEAVEDTPAEEASSDEKVEETPADESDAKADVTEEASSEEKQSDKESSKEETKKDSDSKAPALRAAVTPTPFVYTADETKVPDGYKKDVTREGNVTTVTNTHVPEVTSATVKKVWNDANNQDGKRPANLTVTLSNGTAVTLNAGNEWTATVENLPKYNNGVEINYTWTEDAAGLPDGYTLTNTSKQGTVTTLTNSYTPETTTIKATKVWDDNNNQDGLRDAVTLHLMNGSKEVGSKTIAKGATGDALTVTWDNLPVYEDGEKINYTLTEDAIEGYTSAISALTPVTEGEDEAVAYYEFTVTNTHEPEKIIVNLLKNWSDNENQDGVRPTEIAVNIIANGITVVQTIALNETNNWAENNIELPKYENAGTLISYTVQEVVDAATAAAYNASTGAWTESEDADGNKTYSASMVMTETDDGYDAAVTNTHDVAKTTVKVTKAWDDANNQDGIRPTEISMQLYANEEESGEAVVLNAANNWTHTWTDLDVNAAGTPIEYTVDETAVPDGYEKTVGEVTGNAEEGYKVTITNKHVPATTELEVSKVWEDNNDEEGKRPESVTVTLSGKTESGTVDLANKYEVEVTKTLKGTEWKDAWEDLPVFDGGEEITYSVDEVAVAGYTKEVGEITEVKDDDGNVTGYTVEITNTYTPPTKTVYNEEYTDIVDGNEVFADDVLTYEISYKNTTAGTIKVDIEDEIPANTEYVENSASNGGTFADGKVTWSQIEVAAGATLKVTFKVTVKDEAITGEPIKNDAVVNDGTNEYNTNETSNPTGTPPTKDVFDANATEKTSINGNLVKEGDKLTYEVTYKNTTGKTVDKLTITDPIPANTTYVDNSAVIVGDDTNKGTLADGTLTWVVENVEDGATVTATFQVTVDKNNGVAVDNTGNVRVGENGPDYDTNTTHNPTPSDPVKTGTAVAEGTTYNIDGNKVKAGDTLTYTITYKNTTGKTADIEISDAIPDNTTYVDGSAKATKGTAESISTEGPIVWTFKGLADGEEVAVTFQVTVNDTVSGETIVNDAVVKDGENEYTSNVVTTDTPPKKDVDNTTQGTTSVDGKEVKPGDELKYKITYVNSTDKAENVYFADSIPENTTYKADSAAIDGATATITTTENDGKVTGIAWGSEAEPVEVPANTTVTLTFSVTVDKDSSVIGQTIENEATANKGENTLTTNKVTNPVQTDLLLKKIVQEYVKHKADKVTFGFQVVGYDKKGGKKTFETIIGIDFTADSNVTEQDLVKNLPAETTYVEVTEVYSGGYTAVGDVTKSATVNEDGVFEVTFENKYDGFDYNTGVANKFDKSKTSGGEQTDGGGDQTAGQGDTQGGNGEN